MGANTKFYTPTDIPVMQVVAAVEQTLGVKATHTRLHDEGRFGDFCFAYEGENRTMHVFRKTGDFRPDVPHTCLDMGAWGKSVAIMQQLAPLWGGYLLADDCADQEPVYVPAASDAAVPPLTDEQKLFELVLTHLGYQQAEEVMGFLTANAAAVRALLPH